MAKAQSTHFQPEFPRIPDVAQLYADFNRMFADYGRIFGNGKLPMFDVETVIACQRKNVEALTAANQVVIEGVQAATRRQVELARQAVEAFTQASKELTAPGSAEDRLARQAAIAKEAFETAQASLREVTGLLQKSGDEAAALISKRVSDNFDEVQSALTHRNGAAKK